MKPETLDSIVMRSTLTDEQLVELAREALALELTNPHTYACANDTDAYSRQIAQAVDYYTEALTNAHTLKSAENRRWHDQLLAAKIQQGIAAHEADIALLRWSFLATSANKNDVMTCIQEARDKIAVLQRELDLLVEECKNRDWAIN